MKRLGPRAPGWMGLSDAAGKYRLDGLAEGEYSVEVRDPGHVPWRMTWEAATGKTAELKALLEPGQTLAGMVRRRTASPRPGCACWRGRNGAPASRLPASATPSPWNRVASRLPGCRRDRRPWSSPPPGARPRPSCPCTGWTAWPRALSLEVRLPPAPASWKSRRAPAAGPWRARRKSTCCCRRRTPPGEPLGHALTKAAFRKSWSATVFTGVRYVVVLEAAGHLRREDTVVVPPGEEAFEYRMDLQAWAHAPAVPPRAEASVACTGWAVDAQGKPLAGGKVVLRRRADRDSLLAAVSDGEGRFRFLAVPGVYLVCPAGEGPCARIAAGRADSLPAKVRFGAQVQATVAFTLPMPLPSRGGAVLQSPVSQYRPLESRDGDFLFPALTFRGLPEGRLAAFRLRLRARARHLVLDRRQLAFRRPAGHTPARSRPWRWRSGTKPANRCPARKCVSCPAPADRPGAMAPPCRPGHRRLPAPIAAESCAAWA